MNRGQEMAGNARKAAAMLESALEDLEALNHMLDAFEQGGDGGGLSTISAKMRTMAPRLNELSLDPLCKSRENAPMLLRLSSGMKDAVTRSKQLALVSQRESSHEKEEHGHKHSLGQERPKGYVGISSALDVAGGTSYMSATAGGPSGRSLSCSAPPTQPPVLREEAKDGGRAAMGSSSDSIPPGGNVISPTSDSEDSSTGERKNSTPLDVSPHPLEGWLTKRGEGGIVKVWRMRWFRQVGSRLYYFDNPQSVLANGHIPLKQVKRIVKANVANGIDVVTATRTYHLQALDQQRRDRWFDGLMAWVEYLSNNAKRKNESSGKCSAKESVEEIRVGATPSGQEETAESTGDDSAEEQEVSRDRLLSLEPDSEEELVEELILDDEHSEEEEERERKREEFPDGREVTGVETLRETVKSKEREIAELKQELKVQKEVRAMAGGDQQAYIELLLTQMKCLTEDLSAKEEEVRELKSSCEPMRSELDQLQVKNTSIQTNLQLAREEMKAKDKYITTLRMELSKLKEELPARVGQPPSRQSPGLQRYKEELEKARSSVRAHQTQNVFLSSELQRMEEEHKTYAEAQDQTVRRLKQELKDITKQYQELRQASLVAGGVSNSHLEELEAVKQELFYTLGVGIKLSLSREGRRCNVNIQSLFEEGKHIPFNKYNEWLLHRMTEASVKNK